MTTDDIQSPRELYKKTEKILFALEKLKIKVENDKQDIADMMQEGELKETTHKSINTNEWDAEIDDEIRHKQKIRRREREMIRTSKLISRIERCLKIIKNDEYFSIIPMIYFEQMTCEDVADELCTSTSTIRRNKNRLLGELVVLIYGADALE